ncbi:MAG: TIM barrel protein [Candidatus Bathyarchaeia archaeon]
MADHPRFGPAGVPAYFREIGAKLPDVPKLLRLEELDAFEYAAVRWGQKPQIKQADAEALGVEARRNDVWVSLHGSYYINLSGDPQTLEESKRRLVACATAADWMGAYVVVFHAGYYCNLGKAETYRRVKQALTEVLQTLDGLGIRGVKLGPETMGRHSAFGTLDEVLALCSELPRTQLVIDWSHLHARTGGGLRSAEDFRKVVAHAEEKLGTEAVRDMHCHFSKIEYTYKSGERRHHQLDEPGHGPEFEKLAEVIVEFKLRPVLICETMLQDRDAVKMRNILNKAMRQEKVATAESAIDTRKVFRS